MGAYLFRPDVQRESIGLHSSLRSRVEHGIDRLRTASDASSNFNAICMVQELSFDTSPSILELTSNRSFGVISNARHKSEIRVDATEFVPFSYF